MDHMSNAVRTVKHRFLQADEEELPDNNPDLVA
jgi:hypothetical protein